MKTNTISDQATQPTPCGTLYDYMTGDDIRPATVDERAASIEAESRDNGAGVIIVDGRRCFVV